MLLQRRRSHLLPVNDPAYADYPTTQPPHKSQEKHLHE